jgi:PAS domain S-box-containing protein
MPEEAPRADADDETLQAAFRLLPAAAAILDASFRFVTVNAAFSTEFEYRPEEVLGRKIETLYDDSLHEVSRHAQQLIGEDPAPSFRFERVIVTRSGRRLDAAVRTTALSQGPARRYVALFEQVAEAHRSERLLLSRAEMFRLMVERSPLPISVQDRDWRLVLVNDAYCAFTGYERSELLGRDPAYLVHPPEEIAGLPAQRRAIMSLNIDDFPHHHVIRELVRRDGSRARYHGSLGFSRGPAGEPLWCATLVDLSALDELRGRLSEQTELAHAMRQRFDRFSSLSHDGIAIVERTSDRIVHVNRSLCELLGVDRAALEGSPITAVWAGFVDGDADRIAAVLARTFTQPHSGATVRLQQGDATGRWIRLRAVSGGMHQSEYYLMFEDISDSVEQQRIRDREAEAQVTTIVSEVHHRIKNHLQGVLNLLQPRASADEVSNEMILRAATQVAGIAHIHGILMSSPERAPLARMVVAIADAVSALWHVPVVTTVVDAPDAPAYAVPESESVPVALIVNELLVNAIKHRSGPGPVTVDAEPLRDGVRVRIDNPGSLPPDFDVATRAPASGLGLVRSLIGRTTTRLSIGSEAGRVTCRLELSAPIVVPSGPAAHRD